VWVDGYRCSLDQGEARLVKQAAERAAGLIPAGPGAMADQLPSALSRELEAVARDSDEHGFRLVDLLAPDDIGQLPDSPTEEVPTLPDNDWTAGLLYLIAERLGTLVGYADEKNGVLIHDVCPARGKETFVENVGAGDLGLHTENVHHPMRPDYLALLCLRADHDRIGELCVGQVRAVVRELSPDVLDVLRQPRFHSLYPTSFGLDEAGNRPCSEPHPILRGRPDAVTIRFNRHNTSGTDGEAERALRVFESALNRVSLRIKLVPGQLVVVNNSLVVHGRTPFRPRYDGADRWLRRCYVLRSIPDAIRPVMPRPRVLPRLPDLLTAVRSSS
jgi:L-asparagine oxygenase